jgi:hypothetical protein
MKMSNVEKAIRDEFPGAANKGLRAALRDRWARSGVDGLRGVGRTTGLTAAGAASLRAVIDVAEERELLG